MANTVIQLKYSNVTSQPPTLNVSEPAYSSVSGKLWIDDGTGVVAIGGKHYTQILDNATSAATANTLVRRDSTGNATFNYITAVNLIGSIAGNAQTATKLETARYINISGDGTGSSIFDGSANADITFDLSSTGVAAGTYGGTTSIPVFTVDDEGRLSYAANVSVATTLTVNADSGTNTINLLTDTLTIVGGDGITTSINPTDSVTIGVDNTVIRTTGNQTITGDFTLNGNLIVQGNTTTISVDTIAIEDAIVLYANNNTGNSVDIGFVAHYVEGGTTKHTGLVKNVASNTWYLFDNYVADVQVDHVLNIADPNLVTANLIANLRGGKVTNLTQDISVSDGGTGQSSFTSGAILIGNGSGALQELSNVTYTLTGGLSAANTITSLTVDAYGRVSAATGGSIAINTNQITSGILSLGRGGTNNDAYNVGQLIHFDGTKLSSLANTGTAGTYANASHVPVITTDAYGRVSAITNTAIAIDASQVTSGTLGVARGGTGSSTFTIKGVIVSDTSSSTGALTSLTSSTEGHVLQINSSGAPTFAHINGGTF